MLLLIKMEKNKKMKKEQVRRKERKNIQISLRLSREDSEFFKMEKISPQKVFDLAITELKKEK